MDCTPAKQTSLHSLSIRFPTNRANLSVLREERHVGFLYIQEKGEHVRQSDTKVAGERWRIHTMK